MTLGSIGYEPMPTAQRTPGESKLRPFPSVFTEDLFRLRALVLEDAGDPRTLFESYAVPAITWLSKWRGILSGSDGALSASYDSLACALGMKGLTHATVESVGSGDGLSVEASAELWTELEAGFQASWGAALQRVLLRVRKTSRNRVWLRRRFILTWFSNEMQSAAGRELVSEQIPGFLSKIRAKQVIAVLYEAGVVKKRGPLRVSDNVIRRDVQLIKQVFDEERGAIYAEERLSRLKVMLDWACQQISLMESRRSGLESA